MTVAKQLMWATAALLALSALVPLVSMAQISSIVGRVTDSETGGPVSGAILSVAKSGSPSEARLVNGTTDENGTFELSKSAERGILTLSAKGYATKRVRYPMDPTWPLDIQMEKGSTLTINITDEAGLAIPATVAIATQHPGNYISRAARTSSGVANMVDVASGPTTIIARAEGMAPNALIINVKAGQHYGPLELALTRAAIVKGIVVDGSGYPVTGARVFATYGPEVRHANVLSSFLSAGIQTNQAGTFAIRNIARGATVSVYASKGKSKSALMVVSPPREPSSSDIILKLED